MSFLSVYGGTEKVVVANDGTTEFYVEIKKCLSRRDEADCQKLLTQIKVRDGAMSGELNSTDYLNERVIRSIIDWNLTDLNDARMEVTRDNMLSMPEPAFMTVAARVQELNAPRTKAEEVQFPDQPQERNHVGEGSATDLTAVRDGSAVLQAVGGSEPDAPRG